MKMNHKFSSNMEVESNGDGGKGRVPAFSKPGRERPRGRRREREEDEPT